MNLDHYILLRPFRYLAAFIGISCVTGATAFFIRTPQPTAELFVSWVLVAMCVLFVIIVAAIWVYFFWFWHRTIQTMKQYWWIREQIGGVHLIQPERE
jgi:hypothetical protein